MQTKQSISENSKSIWNKLEENNDNDSEFMDQVANEAIDGLNHLED